MNDFDNHIYEDRPIFKSWVSWRITLFTFLTALITQVFYYGFFLFQFKDAYEAQASGSSIFHFLWPMGLEALGFIVVSSFFITACLMLLIRQLLLRPLFFLRDNLIEASRYPESPKIPPSPFSPTGEIGSAILIAQNLIRENSNNIKQIKSSAESKIYKLAYYDSLTMLPNRASFLQSVNTLVKEMDQEGRFLLIVVDLDNFKDINDSMGHNVGDALLRSVGKRFKNALPDDAIISRAGEDEFAILLPLHDSQTTTETIGKQILDLVRVEPFGIFNEKLTIRSSVGIAVFPHHGTDSEDLLKNADIALNRAKESGRDTWVEYSSDFERAVQERFQILRDLRSALEHDQLALHYQPQLDLKTGRICGAEALLRWWKPDDSKAGGHFVSPGDFIPIAEQSGLIMPIGQWVLKRACTDMKKWRDEHGYTFRIAVNVSAPQFSHLGFADFVRQTMEETGITSDMLELEVTESVFMDDISYTIQTLSELSDMGIELAIDDFGTGYSSLTYLRQFPIDRLKIDQSFIRNALNDPNDASITKTIIALGRSLNLKVIAEGVETREHENFLIREGCDEVQGFRYSKALPLEDFIAFCQNYDGKLDSFSRITG